MTDALSATATTTLPMRTLMRAGNQPERVISLAIDDSIYLALGPALWSRSSRTEARKTERTRLARIRLSGCSALGQENIQSERTFVFRGLRGDRASSTKPAAVTVWIGTDGLLRQQQTLSGWVRYDYRDIRAPDPSTVR
jgi:hypothetical protein